VVVGFRLVKADVKIPVPVPSVVWLPAMVGFCVVDQHTPRAVTVAPPLSVMFPPLEAVVGVMAVIAVVVRMGAVFAVVEKERSWP
jgi:hypothetical protein